MAGGVALGVALETQRLSRDLDVFHDTTEAVSASWDEDRRVLLAAGYAVTAERERAGFVQATVARGRDTLLVEWVRDSAFRFFPLVEHDELGLSLHPFDLATNKVLALVGRAEVRDWIDVIDCDARLQALGHLTWAACGKDPGFSPQALLDHARRTSHYARAEVEALAFEGSPPDPVALSRQWKAALQRADAIVELLPAAHAGEAVLSQAGQLFQGDAAEVQQALASGQIRFHPGRIGGAWPRVLELP